jgi:hypothetical protein
MDEVSSCSFFSLATLRTLKAPTRDQTLAIVDKLWPELSLMEHDRPVQYYAAFFEYIGEEFAALRHNRHLFAAESFDSTSHMIAEFRRSSTQPRRILMQNLQQYFVGYDAGSLLRSMELSARLWLTLNVRSDAAAFGPVQAHVSTIEWKDEVSLAQLVELQFPLSAHLPKEKNPWIDPALTAANLTNVYRIRVHWSNNLIDHLKYDGKRGILTVYQHKICLLAHLRSPSSSIIPVSVLEETVDTLNLLFPFPDSRTENFLSQSKKTFYGLGNCGRPRKLDLREYNYWRDRLVELIRVSDEPPRNWWQLFTDRRNKLQWATFWIAVLVLMLTLIGLAGSTVSAVYSIKQYNLALAQACLASEAAALLPGFCN